MFRLPISAADAIWGWEIYPPIEICLCANVSHIIYYPHILIKFMVRVVMVWLPVLTPWLLPVWFQGSPESGGYQIFWRCALSQCFHHICRIRGLPDECEYEYWLAMAKNYQTEEMYLWWAWVPLKDFLLFYPFSPAIGIYFLSLNRSSHWSIPFPFCKKILVWSACHGSSVNYMLSDIVSSPISLYMQKKTLIGLRLKTIMSRDYINLKYMRFTTW